MVVGEIFTYSMQKTMKLNSSWHNMFYLYMRTEPRKFEDAYCSTRFLTISGGSKEKLLPVKMKSSISKFPYSRKD